MITNKKIFITGGSGFLGKNILKKYYKNNDITVFSRDEAKHYYLKKEFPNVRFIAGDVRNYDLLHRASRKHNIGIFAASFKQIEAVYDNYEEANEVIVKGAFNSRRAAEENNFDAACFISSDKSRAATTIYGAMKYVAGEAFIANVDSTGPKLSSVIYGNVANSTGSIIPMIWNSINKNIPLQLFSTEMTRFIIDIDQAISLIENGLNYNGFNILPNIKSIRILDLFEIYKEKFGLQYTISEPRSGEKIHEIMASNEEVRRMKLVPENNIFIMHPTLEFNNLTFDNNEYSSKDFIMTKNDLISFLENKGYYKP